MEAHTSCCCLREDAVNGPSAIFCFLLLIIASILALHSPSDPVPLLPILRHCLLPSPHPEPTSMTLGSQLFLQIPQPLHISAFRCDSFHAVDPFLSNAPHGRTTRSNLRSTFHHHARFCALPDSCAVVATTVTGVLQAFQWVVFVHISSVSASCLVLFAVE